MTEPSPPRREPIERGRVPTYEPMERLQVPRPVDRIAYIRSRCTALRVLDLGALDETAISNKRGKGTWLHEEIARSALQVDGIDSSASLPPAGLRTAPNAFIHRADGAQLGSLLDRLDLRPDVVVAGELIEHLECPLAFLATLRGNPRLRGAHLLLSTPNATALHNVLVGLLGRESTHHDHLAIFSFKTLTTLLGRAGFERWRIIPYHARFTEMIDRNRGARRGLVVSGQRIINALEWCWPLLAFGYLVEAEI